MLDNINKLFIILLGDIGNILILRDSDEVLRGEMT